MSIYWKYVEADRELKFHSIIWDANGKHDANVENPTIPDGWQWAINEMAASELADDGFPKLTRRQLILALRELGKTEAMVDALLLTILDVDTREKAGIYWRTSLNYGRSHPYVAMIAQALGLTVEEVDIAWMNAVNLDIEQ